MPLQASSSREGYKHRLRKHEEAIRSLNQLNCFCIGLTILSLAVSLILLATGAATNMGVELAKEVATKTSGHCRSCDMAIKQREVAGNAFLILGCLTAFVSTTIVACIFGPLRRKVDVEVEVRSGKITYMSEKSITFNTTLFSNFRRFREFIKECMKIILHRLTKRPWMTRRKFK